MGEESCITDAAEGGDGRRFPALFPIRNFQDGRRMKINVIKWVSEEGGKGFHK